MCAGLGVKVRVSALVQGAGRVLDEKGRCAVSRPSCCTAFWPEPKERLRLIVDRPDTVQRDCGRREVRRRPRTDEDGRATTRPRRTLLEAGGSSDVPLKALRRRLQAACRGEERLSGKRAEVVRATAPPASSSSLPPTAAGGRTARQSTACRGPACCPSRSCARSSSSSPSGGPRTAPPRRELRSPSSFPPSMGAS